MFPFNRLFASMLLVATHLSDDDCKGSPKKPIEKPWSPTQREAGNSLPLRRMLLGPVLSRVAVVL